MTRSIVHGLGVALMAFISVHGAMANPGQPATSMTSDAKAVGAEFAELDRLTGATVMNEMNSDRVSLAIVFQSLGKAAGFKVELKSVPEYGFPIHTGKISVKEALIRLAPDHRLTYEVIGTDKLVVKGPAEK